MVVAGEASGDIHAAAVVRAARQHDPTLHFYGIGGEQMRAAGVETLVDCSEMAVMGLVEIIAHYPRLRRILQQLRQRLAQDRPALLLLVDYPEFNLMLAQSARRLQIPVLFYISPQVWAWRQYRVRRIRRLVDHMAVIFPFELPFYQQAGVPATFVGHPLIEQVQCQQSATAARQALGFDPQRPLIGLFPGSRRSEVSRLLPLQLAAAAQLLAQQPDRQLVLALAPGLDQQAVVQLCAASGLPVRVIAGESHRVMRACDAIVTASGTATLEIALIGTPLVVIYRVAPVSGWLLRRLIKVPHIALCNIVAGERVAPELLQQEVTSAAISEQLQQLLENRHGAADRQRQKLATIQERLGRGGGAAAVAALLQQLRRR